MDPPGNVATGCADGKAWSEPVESPTGPTVWHGGEQELPESVLSETGLP